MIEQGRNNQGELTDCNIPMFTLLTCTLRHFSNRIDEWV